MGDKIIKIYKITNNFDNKVYVGQTCRRLNVRFAEHCRAETILGRAIRKHGKENFEINTIVNTTHKEEADKLEHENVVYYNCVAPNGYNTNEYGRVIGNFTGTCKKYSLNFKFLKDNLHRKNILNIIKLVQSCSSAGVLLKNKSTQAKWWYDLEDICGIKGCKASALLKKDVIESCIFEKVGKKFVLNKEFVNIEFVEADSDE
ncbi:MAG: GIY-YIG nuclease family protein [Cetobacterium sp.]